MKIEPFILTIGITTLLLSASCFVAASQLRKRDVQGLNYVMIALGIAYLFGTFFQFSAAFGAPYLTEQWFLLLRRNVNIGTNIMWIMFVFGVAFSGQVPDFLRNIWRNHVQ